MRTGRHLGKVGAAPALALALTASFFAATSAQGASDAMPVAATSGVQARATACADVLVVGVDGNGERPAASATYGPTVERFADSYVPKVAAGRSVAERRLPLKTPALATLTAGHRPGKSAADAIRRSALRRWSAPVSAASVRLGQVLASAAAACPEQQLVLVGYAQGAKIVHLALTEARRTGYADRITAGVLISDPARRHGIDSRVAKSVAGPPRSTATFGVWNICTSGDLVCAPGRARLGPAVTKARGYRHVSPALKKVRDAALQKTRLWPAPKPPVRIRSTSVGEPLRMPLTADVTNAARAGVLWAAADPLPSGLTLSSDGVLSGKPTESGQSTIRYTVNGTAPTTTPHTGKITLAIGEEATSVTAGGQVSCATDGTGRASCWGVNQFGQLGDGTRTGHGTPERVKGRGWESISTSGATTCGIKTGGALWCWGLNNFSQLGIGKSSPRPNPQQVAPGQVWQQVATSWFNTCAINTSGALYCWGQNLRGSVGIGKNSRMVTKPRLIGSAGDGWTAVSTGGWHTCGVRADGSMWCWGQNTFGQVGNTSVGVQSTPTRVGVAGNWRDVSTSWGNSCGVTATGDLWCWGLNKDGQIGNGTRGVDAWTPQQVAPGQVWTNVAVGDASACALDSSGQPWCWGGDRYGQLGTTTSAASTVPVRADAVSGLTAITVGWMHGCGLSGTVPACWGSNETGQLGTASSRARKQAAVSSYDLARQRDVVRRGLADLRLSVDDQVEQEIGDRPSVPAAAREKKDSFTTKVLTFNLLGSQHTGATGDRPDWAPGRIRSEWASSLIAARSGSLAGIQEIQPDQVVSLDTATDGKYTIWPGTTMGYAGAPQSVMWRNAQWKAVWKDTITIPFMRTQPRPQPVVRLRHRGTGQELYWINVHFSPGKMEDERRKATAIVVKTIKKLQKDHLPILLTGDFNDHDRVFCQVTGKTTLVAALGGSTGDTCKPPAGRRVDWIFGSGGTFGSLAITQGGQVRRTTDHAVQDVPFSVQ